MTLVLDGFLAALQISSILAMLAGTLLGVMIGALPGLNPVMAIALMLPLTYGMEPLTALGMIAGIYNGSMYGGAIPAILMRIPGTPAAIATTFDGFPMARQGRAAEALKIACWSSAIGGAISALALLTLAPLLAQVTLLFGPAEYFWIAVFGLASVAAVVGKDLVKGLSAAAIGLLLGTIGIDQVSGQQRYTFDSLYLLNGFDLIVVLVGLYAVPPVLQMAEAARLTGLSRADLRLQTVRLGPAVLRRHARSWGRSGLIGVAIGILPGAGGNIAALLSCNAAKRAAADPDSFGKGNPDGVAAAECGNNADNAAAMIPALTLGIPGNIVAALILGALLIHGLQPGPRLFHDNADIVFGFGLQMLLTALALVVLGGLAATRAFAQLQRLPGVMLVPLILILTMVGVFIVNGRVVDIWVMLGFGLLGYLLERLDYPLAPVVLGLLLGPMAERSLRLALLIARGDWTVLVTRPISLTLAAMTVGVLVLPLLRRRWAEHHARRPAP